jgi:predicted Zn-dependent protease
MAIFSKDEAYRILKKVLSYSKADECEANLDGRVGGNIRYARNTVTTSGNVSDATLIVESKFGKKVGTTTLNEFDDASLEKAVRRSEELARLAPENPEVISCLTPQTYLDVKATFATTAGISPDYRAKVADDSILPCRTKDLTAAGFMEHRAEFHSMMNTTGLEAYFDSTSLDFNLTVRTNDGKGSGYVSRDYNDVSKFDSTEVSQIAIDKALQSREAKAIEPGKYTVILEPSALVSGEGLLENLVYNMDARSADEGRSFFSKAGGGSKLGEKIIDERITIYTDPQNPEVPSQPWSGDGRPQEKIAWIENGVVKNLMYSRYWAKKQGVKATPFPNNFQMKGGDATTEDLIKDTKKGILVTRLWYIREVDPQTLLFTGLTRDGTFYIENGKIKYPVKNFRFNESPVIMLNNLEALGKPVRMNGNLVPPMKIRDFTFTSLSDAV